MNKKLLTFLHVAFWAFMFLSPLTFWREGGLSLKIYLMSCMSPLLLLTVFYANYFWLTPRFFIKDRKTFFWVFNTVMVVCLGVLLHYWMEGMHAVFEMSHSYPHHEPNTTETLMFILRDIFTLAIAAAVATAIVLALRWQNNVDARLRAEAAQADAELRNLRSQLNPHFLLNTLNNIYALTAIDPSKAQEAIQQLSKLLRHMLYDNQPEVELQEEMQFMENYVYLMRLRLPHNVDVKMTTDIDDPHIKVAPLLPISLVENAFKHGISPTEPCFVHILVRQKERLLTLAIDNSNHPKTQKDRSGHGIGLQQVQRRLDLAYSGRYEWTKGVSDDGQTYHSQIKITL